MNLFDKLSIITKNVFDPFDKVCSAIKENKLLENDPAYLTVTEVFFKIKMLWQQSFLERMEYYRNLTTEEKVVNEFLFMVITMNMFKKMIFGFNINSSKKNFESITSLHELFKAMLQDRWNHFFDENRHY